MVPDDELTMDCSEGNKVGSNCTFECPPDQVIFIAYEIHTVNYMAFLAYSKFESSSGFQFESLNTSDYQSLTETKFDIQTLIGSKWRECTSTGQWSNTMPICRQCSHLKSDLVFIIDGSWSVGDENFRKAKDFMKALGKHEV